MAVNLSNYKKIPVIGEVKEIENDRFKIHYWKGTFFNKWQPNMIKNKKSIIPWTDWLPMGCILLRRFYFDDKTGKLTRKTRKFLKEKYEELRSVDFDSSP